MGEDITLPTFLYAEDHHDAEEFQEAEALSELDPTFKTALDDSVERHPGGNKRRLRGFELRALSDVESPTEQQE